MEGMNAANIETSFDLVLHGGWPENLSSRQLGRFTSI
jgi:hypothetical protein